MLTSTTPLPTPTHRHTVASAQYYDIISAARNLPLDERRLLAEALHLDIAALATYEVRIDRSPDATGSTEPEITHLEVHYQDPDRTMADTRTHVSTTVRLRRALSETRMTLTQRELYGMPPSEVRNHALDLIEEARRRPLVELTQRNLHSSASKQRLGVQILEGVDKLDLEVAVEGLTRRLVA